MLNVSPLPIAAIETGGTKCIVAVGYDIERATQHLVPTASPGETLQRIANIIQTELAGARLGAIGVASFGPIEVDATKKDYGAIGKTPKEGWEGINLRSYFEDRFDCPVTVESDVNGAALAESQWGLTDHIQHLTYVTVGTGIGVGVIQSGNLSNGVGHPEIGHICMDKHPSDLNFEGTCPFHGNCLEGMAAGPAILKRWDSDLSQLPTEHIGHDIESHYLGQLAANLVLHHRPQVIVYGGGVLKTPGLLTSVRKKCQTALNGYLPTLDSPEAMDELIHAPRLGSASGLMGAFMLGQAASR